MCKAPFSFSPAPISGHLRAAPSPAGPHPMRARPGLRGTGAFRHRAPPAIGAVRSRSGWVGARMRHDAGERYEAVLTRAPGAGLGAHWTAGAIARARLVERAKARAATAIAVSRRGVREAGLDVGQDPAGPRPAEPTGLSFEERRFVKHSLVLSGPGAGRPTSAPSVLPQPWLRPLRRHPSRREPRHQQTSLPTM